MKASKIKLVQKNRIAHARDQLRNHVMFQRKQEIQFKRDYAMWGIASKKVFGV